MRSPLRPVTGSLSRRMIVIAALWTTALLVGGGLVLDRVLKDAITDNFDSNLEYLLMSMIRSAEVGPEGEVFLNTILADQRYLEPYSGSYWQIMGKGQEPFISLSLWERELRPPPRETQRPVAGWFDHLIGIDGRPGGKNDPDVVLYDTSEFPDEALRVASRKVQLPGSDTVWTFQVAQQRASLDAQVADVQRVLIPSFAVLWTGLLALAALQSTYGLWPLRHIRRALAAVRQGDTTEVDAALPIEVQPMVDELNALIAHNAKQAEDARMHAGNLAHALKTPLTVLTNAAASDTSDLGKTVLREASVMQRQVDHHLARARALGRRGQAQVRCAILPSVDGVTRAIARMYPGARVDHDVDDKLSVRVERQDLDEMIGNLVDNAAKYGGGSVFVSAKADGGFVEILVEDDGAGIAPQDRGNLFQRGVRLDSGKPGTGLGLAIVRDVAELYGGSVELSESEDLGGLSVALRLPAA